MEPLNNPVVKVHVPPSVVIKGHTTITTRQHTRLLCLPMLATPKEQTCTPPR